MKFLKTHIARLPKQRGFTLLLAALVSAIALSLGTSIYTIVSKEFLLSSIGRDSQFAFYAADTAAECALFWDQRSDKYPNTFATSSGDTSATLENGSNPSNLVECDNVPVTSVVVTENGNAATTSFEIANLFESPAGNAATGYCADVTVSKFPDSSGATRTYVDVNGYNVGCSAIATSQNALQRSVQLQY